MRTIVLAATAAIFASAGVANAQSAPAAPSVQPDMSNMSGDAADRFLERQTNYSRMSENVSASSRALRAVPARSRDVVQGLEVRDATGLVIGTVAKVSDGYAVVASSLGSVEVDVGSLAKNKLGLLINLPKDKIDAMMTGGKPAS